MKKSNSLVDVALKERREVGFSRGRGCRRKGFEGGPAREIKLISRCFFKDVRRGWKTHFISLSLSFLSCFLAAAESVFHLLSTMEKGTERS
jgi:hypothetical protein